MVAAAKRWLRTYLKDYASLYPEALTTQWAADNETTSPVNVPNDDPARQERLVRYWRHILALRQAIYDLHRSSVLVPYADPTHSEGFFNKQFPEIPIDQPGQAITDHKFRAPVLFTEYRLSPMDRAEREHRLELYDAKLFAAGSDLDAFDDRTRRCVIEALACYRNDLFLAAANMLGAASESAWHQIAEAMETASLASTGLAKELGEPQPRASYVQTYALADLNQMGSAKDFFTRFGFQRGVLNGLGQTAAFWRDLRNYGMHPLGALPREMFSHAALSVQLLQATDYFSRLAALRRGL
jgi:hypothetical protein